MECLVWQGSGVVFWVALRGVAPSCSGTIFVSHLCTCESGNSCTGLSVCPTLVLCWLLRLCNESWCWQLYSSSGWFYLFLALCISNSVFFFLIKKKNLAAPWSMWDLSSPTKGWTHAACSGSQESLTTGLLGKSPNSVLGVASQLLVFDWGSIKLSIEHLTSSFTLWIFLISILISPFTSGFILTLKC